MIGIIIAGTEGSSESASLTIAYPIKEILDWWAMRLLRSRRGRGWAGRRSRR